MDLLKAPIFENISKYIENELKVRYLQILDLFIAELDHVLKPDQRERLKESSKSIESILICPDMHVKLDLYYNTYSPGRAEKDEKKRCQARIAGGKQCKRAYVDIDIKLCGVHTKINPHGKITGSNPMEEAKVQKRLQFYHKVVKNLKNIDLSEYIKTTEIELDNNIYLLDDNGILYDRFNLSILAYIRNYKVYWFGHQKNEMITHNLP